MNTKTIVSGAGKNLVGMEWSNLQDGYCPKCDAYIDLVNDMYRCRKCDFVITIGRYTELVGELDK